jgi:uncharacterized membrane protein HdeD (DUF308 family)
MTTETDRYYLDLDKLRENLGWFTALGLAMIVLGLIAVSTPFLASVALKRLVGAIFVVGSVIHVIHAFRSWKWSRSVPEFLLSVLFFVAGFILLVYPIEGLITLTAFLAAFFVVEGVFKVIEATRLRPVSNWGWLLVSGLVSVFLGIIIWAGLPMTAFWAIGLIVGIDLIFGGISMIMVSVSMRAALRERRPFCIGNVCFQ